MQSGVAGGVGQGRVGAPLQEEGNRSNAFKSRDFERRFPAPVAEIDIGAGLEKHLQHGQRVVAAVFHSRLQRAAFLVDCIGIGSAAQIVHGRCQPSGTQGSKQAHVRGKRRLFGVPLPVRLKQLRAARYHIRVVGCRADLFSDSMRRMHPDRQFRLVVFDKNAGPAGQQDVNQGFLLKDQGIVQHRIAMAVAGVGISAVIEQQLHSCRQVFHVQRRALHGAFRPGTVGMYDGMQDRPDPVAVKGYAAFG